MAKEADFKKVELKVSIDCCDGCKKKVKKLVQNIKGVLKIELDPMQPKATVVGNVDPQFLIKKLHKVGKQAEILKVSAVGDGDNKQKDHNKDKEKDMSPTNNDKDNKVTTKEDQKEKNLENNLQETYLNPAEESIEVKYTMYPSMVVGPANQPGYQVLMPYYAGCSYIAPLPPSPPQAGFGGEYERPPVFEAPFGRVENYFNEDNTVGCHVM